ncbi:10587_t:CDS:2, partial [Funneliformis caledonium]
MSQLPKRVYYSRSKIPNTLQMAPGQQPVLFHPITTLPVHPVRLTTAPMFNDKFGNENDKLMIESNELKAELTRYRQYRVSRNIPSPIIDKRSASLNEMNVEKARTEMKNLMKGQILAEYQLDYEKTFFEQSTTIYEKLIPELKRLMDEVFNPSTGALEKIDRRLHANTQLSE